MKFLFYVKWSLCCTNLSVVKITSGFHRKKNTSNRKALSQSTTTIRLHLFKGTWLSSILEIESYDFKKRYTEVVFPPKHFVEYIKIAFLKVILFSQWYIILQKYSEKWFFRKPSYFDDKFLDWQFDFDFCSVCFMLYCRCF